MHNSKICFKCNTCQPLSDFYKHKEMADGHLNKCKTCTKKDTKENIAKNPDYYAEYDRQRDQLPHRIEMKKKYSQTESGIAAGNRAKIKWDGTNLIKRAASTMVGNAVRDGKIVKPNECDECGKSEGRIHGHHDDYAFPLTVRWLCPLCHTKWHKENGEGVNGC